MHSLLDRYKSEPKDKAVRLGSHVYRQECMVFCRNGYQVELIATALKASEFPGEAWLICAIGKKGACLSEMILNDGKGQQHYFITEANFC